jgi:hypothetical protein
VDGARARALYEKETTDENAALIRSFHRSLEGSSSVWMCHDRNRPSVWLVPEVNSVRLFDTHAGGLMIHYMPRVYKPVPWTCPYIQDPIARKINPRRFLTAEDIRSIRNIFPSSIGVRVLISGWVVIHFEDVKTMESAWESGFPDTVGALRVGCMVTRFVPSFPVGYGHAINSDARGGEEGCLGLRLTLPSGQEVITTTMHAFVKLMNSKNSFRLRISEWYLKLRNALRTSKPIPSCVAVLSRHSPIIQSHCKTQSESI